PLMRAFRLDKMTLAALETTLRIYLDEERALREVPVLRMLGVPLKELRRRAEALAARLREVPGIRAARAAEDGAFVGGGSLPDQAMKTCVVEVEAAAVSDAALAYRLRTGSPAVMGRLRDGKLVLDVRTVFAEQEDVLTEAIRQAVADGEKAGEAENAGDGEGDEGRRSPTGRATRRARRAAARRSSPTAATTSAPGARAS